MGNLKEITCEICGRKAYVSTKQRCNYCEREECVKEFKKRKWREYTNRYMRKRRAEESKETEIKTVINNQRVNTDALDKLVIYDIREIARELGTIRFRLIELYQKENEQVKDLSKEDITLLHAFELEDLTKEQVWNMYREAKTRRTSRRVEKYRKALIGTLLNSITIKNPDKFIVQAVNDGRVNKNFTEVIEELKKDETLFSQTKEEVVK